MTLRVLIGLDAARGLALDRVVVAAPWGFVTGCVKAVPAKSSTRPKAAIATGGHEVELC